MLEMFFRSNAEVKVLGVVLFTDGLHLREIARRAAVSPSEAKPELDILCRAGLLKSERKGRQVFFHLDGNCPFLPEMTGLYLKTEGVIQKLKVALDGFSGIKYAFIFGSFAGGKAGRRSDIDLMVIGDVDEKAVADTLFAVQQGIAREINFILWAMADLKEKIKSNSAFLKTIVVGDILWLGGNRDEFIRTVKERPR